MTLHLTNAAEGLQRLAFTIADLERMVEAGILLKRRIGRGRTRLRQRVGMRSPGYAKIKNVYVALISLLFAFVFGWGIGSYVAWNVDPGSWTDGRRIIHAIVIGATCVLTFLGIQGAGRRRRSSVGAAAKDNERR